MEFPSFGVAYSVGNKLRVGAYASHWPGEWVDKSEGLPLSDMEVEVVGREGITLLIKPIDE